MIAFRMETEIAALDSTRAAAEAALAQLTTGLTPWNVRPRTIFVGVSQFSPRSSLPCGRRSPRRSPSPPSEVAALLQLSQQQQQHAAADKEHRHVERRDEHRRGDLHGASKREERLEARIAEREARLEAGRSTGRPTSWS
jgi:hypothetical protein